MWQNETQLPAFLDIAQAFEKVWHQRFIYQINKMRPSVFPKTLTSYITGGKFFIKHGTDMFGKYNIGADSVIGLMLYLFYTTDLPICVLLHFR